MQNVKVLAVDLDKDQRSEKTALRQSVTLEVTNEQAQKLFLMQDSGELILTLRAAGEANIEPEYTAKLKDVFDKVVLQDRQQAVIRRPAQAVTPQKDDALPQVTIIRGNDRNQVSVMNDAGPLNDSGLFEDIPQNKVNQ